MKKLFTIIALIFLISLLAACTASPAAVSASNTLDNPAKTNTPTSQPSKKPLEEVFGKSIKLAAISNGDDAASELFFAGVKKEAGELGIEVTTAAAPDDFGTQVGKSDADGIIAYLPNKLSSYSALEDAAKKGKAVSVFDLDNEGSVTGISRTYYNREAEADTALNAVLNYPPHEEPVRLLSMFESKDSKVYLSFDAAVKAGKVFPKSTYIKSDETGSTPNAWLAGKLGKYVEGMIDAVYAENESLSVEALDALEAKTRTDMEVISIGLSKSVLERMQKNPEVFVQAVGPNSVFAGVLNTRIVLNMLKDQKPVSEELTPCTVNAADLKEDAVSALAAQAPEELLKKYNQTWMDDLRAKTGK